MVPGTELLNAWQQQVKKRALAPSEAYAVAVAADRVREPQAEVGYRLYWMNDQVLGSQDVVARPSGFAVIGRHGSCDVVIDDERVVSLRHLLVRASSLDDGFPVISLLDLQTSAGFELSDGSRQRSVAATGPVVFRIGTHSLVALPSTGKFPEQLPAAVVERNEHAPQHRARPAPIANAPQRVEAGPRHDLPPPSRITLLPHSVVLSERPSAAFSARGHDYVPTGEGYEVTLEAGGRLAGVRLTSADLEHGVLIGRADKCVDDGMRSILSDTISRVHVLLIREKGMNHLYDVASLSGTFAGGRRVRCLALDDSGTTAMLTPHHNAVTLHWRAL